MREMRERIKQGRRKEIRKKKGRENRTEISSRGKDTGKQCGSGKKTRKKVFTEK